jgi:hypothetical protein
MAACAHLVAEWLEVRPKSQGLEEYWTKQPPMSEEDMVIAFRDRNGAAAAVAHKVCM